MKTESHSSFVEELESSSLSASNIITLLGIEITDQHVPILPIHEQVRTVMKTENHPIWLERRKVRLALIRNELTRDMISEELRDFSFFVFNITNILIPNFLTFCFASTRDELIRFLSIVIKSTGGGWKYMERIVKEHNMDLGNGSGLLFLSCFRTEV